MKSATWGLDVGEARNSTEFGENLPKMIHDFCCNGARLWGANVAASTGLRAGTGHVAGRICAPGLINNYRARRDTLALCTLDERLVGPAQLLRLHRPWGAGHGHNAERRRSPLPVLLLFVTAGLIWVLAQSRLSAVVSAARGAPAP